MTTSSSQTIQTLRENVCKAVVIVSKMMVFSYGKRPSELFLSRDDGRGCQAEETTENEIIRIKQNLLSCFSSSSCPERRQKQGRRQPQANHALDMHTLNVLARMHVLCKQKDAEACARCAKDVLLVRDAQSTWTVDPIAQDDVPGETPMSAKQRADVVWYIWKLTRLMTKGVPKSYVMRLFQLYRFRYKASLKVARIPLLFLSFAVVMGESFGNITAVAPREQAISFKSELITMLARAEEHLYLLYQDIEQNEQNEKNEENEENEEKTIVPPVEESSHRETDPIHYDDDEKNDDREADSSSSSSSSSLSDDDDPEERLYTRILLSTRKVDFMRFFTKIDVAKRIEMDQEKELVNRMRVHKHDPDRRINMVRSVGGSTSSFTSSEPRIVTCQKV